MKKFLLQARNNLRQARLSDPKYHFIHIPKNAGNAVRRAAEKRGDVSLSVPYHYRYVDVVRDVGTDLKYFCVIRNPWSRTASRYQFGLQNAEKWPQNDPRRSYMATATFEDFVKDQKRLSPQHPDQPWMSPFGSWFNQLEWIADEGGNVMCDCLRLGHLENDLSDYFGERISAAKKNATKRDFDYKTMYTDELKEIIHETFKQDIEYFGFGFEGDATRNIAVL